MHAVDWLARMTSPHTATVTADRITFDNIGTTSIVPTATNDPSFAALPARYHQGTPSSGAPQFFTLATTAAFPPSVPGSN
jgi:hypothetical protein